MNSESTNTQSKPDLSSETMAKEGYRKTKYGWIPEEWKLYRFDNVFTFIKSYSFSRNDLTFNEDEGDTYYIHYGDIHAKFDSLILHLESENHSGIPLLKKASKPDKELTYLAEGDLVIADASEDYDGVGECVEIGEINNSKKIVAGLHTLVARDKSGKTTNRYRAYILKSWPVAKELKKIATGISVYGISKSNLSKLKIPLPPLPEQKKIAEILSTWDEAIDKIERLITKKKELKKGLMQQLLTVAKGKSAPKTRFLGFEKKWKRMRLNKVFDFLRSISVSRKDLEVINHQNGTLNVHYGDIHTKFNSVSCLDVGRSKNIPSIVDDYSYPSSIDYAKDGDVIMVDASEDYEGVGECIELENVGEKKLTAGQHTFLLRDKKDLTVTGFRSLIFEQREVKKQLKRVVTGSKVFGLSKTNLSKIKVFIPSKDEQRRIVQVLQNIESEIERLKSLERYLGIQKNGLMQQLLTGRTRVQT